jgi:hypothetical protein
MTLGTLISVIVTTGITYELHRTGIVVIPPRLVNDINVLGFFIRVVLGF